MTQRQLDLALLAGIGVLLVVILILALSGAPTSAAGDISDPVDRVNATALEAGDAAEPASEPTPAVATGDTAAGAVGNPEETTTAQDAAEAVAVEETFSAQSDESGAALQAETSVAPPVDGVRLERIGFAYATGSEGACGVPLEAWGYVAVSRDLLTDFPCGTAVTLTLDDEINGRREVTAQVGDTMGADITDTVNIFVGQDEPALEYGVTGGTLSQ